MSADRCIGCDRPGMMAERLGPYGICLACKDKGAGLMRGRGGRVLYVRPSGEREGARQRKRSNERTVAPRNPLAQGGRA